MITETQSQLLTGYVDGELSPAQRKAAARLLEESVDARALLEQLQGDAAQIRDLPQHRLDPGFAERVIQALPHRRFTMRLAGRSEQRTVPAWVGLATAASIVLAVTAGTYVYFGSRGQGADQSGAIAKRDAAKDDENKTDGTGKIDVAKNDKGKKPEEKPIEGGMKETPVVKKEFVGPPEPPDNATEPALAYPVPLEKMELFTAQVADVRPPVIMKMREFAGDKFKGELKKDQGYRLEMPSRDSAKAFARIEAAIKARGLTLVIEPVAQLRLKQPKAKTNFVFYADDLTPDELTALLKQLGDEDKAIEAKHKGDGLFEAVVLNPMSVGDHKELTQLLGIDPRPAAAKGTAVDPKKPLSDMTADQVVKIVANPGAKGTERLAIAMAYNPERPRTNSAEVKRFLDGRRPARPGTVQVLLVVRQL